AETPAPLTNGLPASPGAAVGVIALSASQAVSMHAEGHAVILLTQETTADDIHGRNASVGFLTARGGATSHAAVVARGMGKCCITGANGLEIDEARSILRADGVALKEGDWLSIDGATGRIFAGQLPLKKVQSDNPWLKKLLAWSRG